MSGRSELAYDEHGKRFAVPAHVAGWRVRRFNKPGKRGGCEIVYDNEEHTPLILDVEAGGSDFRSAVNSIPGRYRLDGVDEEGEVLRDVPPAYLVISDAKPASRGDEPPATTSSVEWALVEAVRANSASVATMSSSMSSLVQAASVVLQAADAAGITKRLPPPVQVVANDEEDDDPDNAQDVAARQGSDVFGVLNQLVSMVQTFQTMGTKTAAAPPAASASARYAEPAAPPGGYGDEDEVEDAEEAEPERQRASSSRSAQTVKRDSGQHFHDIQARLTDEERAFLHRAITKLSMGELMKWRDQLAQLSVDQAVALLRAEMAGQSGRAEAMAS